MTTHSSAPERPETPHETETTTITISKAVKRRAQSVINDRSIDAESRAWIRYALEINDPWLTEFVRRVDAGKAIDDTIDFSQTPTTSFDDDSSEERSKR